MSITGIKISNDSRVIIDEDWTLVGQSWSTTFAKPLMVSASSSNSAVIEDVEVLKRRLDALLKTIEELKADNLYLKEMMDEEFRSKNE